MPPSNEAMAPVVHDRVAEYYSKNFPPRREGCKNLLHLLQNPEDIGRNEDGNCPPLERAALHRILIRRNPQLNIHSKINQGNANAYLGIGKFNSLQIKG